MSEMFYKCPGPHRGPNGKTFGYVSAEKCPEGHFETLPEAVEGKAKKAPTPAQKKHVKETTELLTK